MAIAKRETAIADLQGWLNDLATRIEVASSRVELDAPGDLDRLGRDAGSSVMTR